MTSGSHLRLERPSSRLWRLGSDAMDLAMAANSGSLQVSLMGAQPLSRNGCVMNFKAEVRKEAVDLAIATAVDSGGVESLLMGADGWIAGLVCAFPQETVAIYELQKAGRIKEAIEIYRWFLPLLELDINPKLVQNIKMAEVATGIGTENVRPPRLPLHGEERTHVLAVIAKGMRTRPTLPEYRNLRAEV